MVKAIREAGIPIDMAGGVSIGAFIGALRCKEQSVDNVTSRAGTWFFVSISLRMRFVSCR